MSNFEQQAAKIRNQPGFIAALDQSGGSTPKALKLYGVAENTYSGETQMMDLIHAMRSRIITSPSFGGNRIAGAILFEATMDREVLGVPTAEFLWTKKQVVPFLKIDKGLADEANGVQLMKPMPTLDAIQWVDATAPNVPLNSGRMRGAAMCMLLCRSDDPSIDMCREGPQALRLWKTL